MYIKVYLYTTCTYTRVLSCLPDKDYLEHYIRAEKRVVVRFLCLEHYVLE
jgi:hypothetical protein